MTKIITQRTVKKIFLFLYNQLISRRKHKNYTFLGKIPHFLKKITMIAVANSPLHIQSYGCCKDLDTVKYNIAFFYMQGHYQLFFPAFTKTSQFFSYYKYQAPIKTPGYERN